MISRDPTLCGAVLGAALALLTVPALAQAPRPPARPAPPPSAVIEAPPPPTAARRRDFYLKPETERAAEDSEAKMDAIQRKIDARVQRATRSICAGCTSAPPSGRRRMAAPRISDEPVVDDPARAPVQ